MDWDLYKKTLCGINAATLALAAALGYAGGASRGMALLCLAVSLGLLCAGWWDGVKAALLGRVWVSEYLHERYMFRGGSIPRWLRYTLVPLHVDRHLRFVRVWWFCYGAGDRYCRRPSPLARARSLSQRYWGSE